jgi:hypothetical protein
MIETDGPLAPRSTGALFLGGPQLAWQVIFGLDWAFNKLYGVV